MKILVTGTPGTGKTTFSEALSKKLNLKHHNLSKIISENQLGKKKGDIIIFDHKKLKKKFQNLEGILDTHCPEIITNPDIVILMKCNIEELKKEYLKRGYSQEKIQQNLEYEILNVGEDFFPINLILYREKQTIQEMIELCSKFIENYEKKDNLDLDNDDNLENDMTEILKYLEKRKN